MLNDVIKTERRVLSILGQIQRDMQDAQYGLGENILLNAGDVLTSLYDDAENSLDPNSTYKVPNPEKVMDQIIKTEDKIEKEVKKIDKTLQECGKLLKTLKRELGV